MTYLRPRLHHTLITPHPLQVLIGQGVGLLFFFYPGPSGALLEMFRNLRWALAGARATRRDLSQRLFQTGWRSAVGRSTQGLLRANRRLMVGLHRNQRLLSKFEKEARQAIMKVKRQQWSDLSLVEILMVGNMAMFAVSFFIPNQFLVPSMYNPVLGTLTGVFYSPNVVVLGLNQAFLWFILRPMSMALPARTLWTLFGAGTVVSSAALMVVDAPAYGTSSGMASIWAYMFMKNMLDPQSRMAFIAVLCLVTASSVAGRKESLGFLGGAAGGVAACTMALA